MPPVDQSQRRFAFPHRRISLYEHTHSKHFHKRPMARRRLRKDLQKNKVDPGEKTGRRERRLEQRDPKLLAYLHQFARQRKVARDDHRGDVAEKQHAQPLFARRPQLFQIGDLRIPQHQRPFRNIGRQVARERKPGPFHFCMFKGKRKPRLPGDQPQCQLLSMLIQQVLNRVHVFPNGFSVTTSR